MLTGFEAKAGGGSHAYLIDRGTADRYQKKRNNKYVGRVTGNRFWIDTEAQDYPEALDKLYEGKRQLTHYYTFGSFRRIFSDCC